MGTLVPIAAAEVIQAATAAEEFSRIAPRVFRTIDQVSNLARTVNRVADTVRPIQKAAQTVRGLIPSRKPARVRSLGNSTVLESVRLPKHHQMPASARQSRRRGGGKMAAPMYMGNAISGNMRPKTGGRGATTSRGQDAFIGAVAGSTAFSARQYEVNPGLAYRNPALAKEAARYDQYRFTKLRFTFIPTKAVTTTPGMVGLCLDPNPNTSPPQTLAEFSAYRASTLRSVYDKITLDVPKDMLTNFRYCRQGPSGSDLILYDVGTLILLTQGMASTDEVGFLQIEYEVVFKNYHLEPSERVAVNCFWMGTTTTVVPSSTRTLVPLTVIREPPWAAISAGKALFPPGLYSVDAVLTFQRLTSVATPDLNVELELNGSTISSTVLTLDFTAVGECKQVVVKALADVQSEFTAEELALYCTTNFVLTASGVGSNVLVHALV